MSGQPPPAGRAERRPRRGHGGVSRGVGRSRPRGGGDPVQRPRPPPRAAPAGRDADGGRRRLRDGLTSASTRSPGSGAPPGSTPSRSRTSDAELVLRCAAATISPREETGLDPEEEATLLTLEHADWLGAILSVVRRGPGADASPEALVAASAPARRSSSTPPSTPTTRPTSRRRSGSSRSPGRCSA